MAKEPTKDAAEQAQRATDATANSGAAQQRDTRQGPGEVLSGSAMGAAATPATETEVPGIFTELNQRLKGAAQPQTSGRFTFGSWARAKGYTADRLATLVRSGKLKLPAGAHGDGPEMTEEEFDEAIGHQYTTQIPLPPNTFVTVVRPNAPDYDPNAPERVGLNPQGDDSDK